MQKKVQVGTTRKGVPVHVTWDTKLEEELKEHGIDAEVEMEALIKELGKKDF